MKPKVRRSPAPGLHGLRSHGGPPLPSKDAIWSAVFSFDRQKVLTAFRVFQARNAAPFNPLALDLDDLLGEGPALAPQGMDPAARDAILWLRNADAVTISRHPGMAPSPPLYAPLTANPSPSNRASLQWRALASKLGLDRP